MDNLMRLPEKVREGLIPIQLEMEKEMNKVGLKAPGLLHVDFRKSIIGKSDDKIDFNQLKAYFQKEKNETMLKTIDTIERIAKIEQHCYYYEKPEYAMMLDFENDESIFYVADEDIVINKENQEADDNLFIELATKEGFEQEGQELKIKKVFFPEEVAENKYRMMYKINKKHRPEIRLLEYILMSYAKKVVEKAQVQLDRRNKEMENVKF